MEKQIRSKITDTDIVDWKWRMFCSMSISKDGHGKYIFNKSDVDAIMSSIDDENVRKKIEYGIDPICYGSEIAQSHRKIYSDEIRAYLEDMHYQLPIIADDWDVYCMENIACYDSSLKDRAKQEYAKHFTINQAKENLRIGLSPKEYIESLFRGGYIDGDF